MQIVGVNLRLVRTHRVLPATQRSHDSLHIKVAPLDDTHLDRRTATQATLLGKLYQFGLEAPRIRQIRLYHDTRRVAQELRLGQYLLEQAHR